MKRLIGSLLLICTFSLSFYSPVRLRVPALELPGNLAIQNLDLTAIRILANEKRNSIDSLAASLFGCAGRYIPGLPNRRAELTGTTARIPSATFLRPGHERSPPPLQVS